MRPSTIIGVIGGGGAPWRTASTYNRVATSAKTGTPGSGPIRMANRLIRDIGSGDVSVLRVRLDNIAFKVDSTVGGYGSDITIVNCFLEYLGASKRVTFNGGSNTVVVPNGAYDVQSDDILPSLWGVGSFVRNGQPRIRIEVEAPDGGSIPVMEGTDGPVIEGASFYPSSGAAWTNVSGTGPMAFTGTGTSNFGYPAILIGKYVSGDPRTFGLVGDSIFAQGNKQSYGVNALYRNAGAMLSGMQVGRVGGIAHVQTSYPVAVGSYTKLFNTAIEEYGTNLSASNLAANQASALASWAFLRSTAVATPGAPFMILRPWIINKNTSGANCSAGSDASLQVLATNFGSGGAIEQLNDWFSTQIGVGNGPDLVFDPMSGGTGTIRASQTRGDALYYRWDTTVTLTSDGVHPNVTCAAILGGNLRTVLPT